jgi:hypothetical protein
MAERIRDLVLERSESSLFIAPRSNPPQAREMQRGAAYEKIARPRSRPSSESDSPYDVVCPLQAFDAMRSSPPLGAAG